jgi:2'-5' RNA ligase
METPPSEAGGRRLFFALWPPRDTAATLRRVAEALPSDGRARLVPAPNLHVTLVFLGRTADARVADAVAAARSVECPAFAIEVDRLGYWSRTRVLWAGPRIAPPGLAELAETLKRALGRAGFECDERTLAAHVTLARKAGRPGRLPPLPAARWNVTEFVLVESTPTTDGSRYDILERFALAAGAPAQPSEP